MHTLSCPAKGTFQELEVMAFTKNDEAVSPVIGVILMVAVTVILAAVIAAFVFGMAGNMSKGKVVAFTATKSGNTITVTNMGGQDAGGIESLKYTLNGGTPKDLAAETVGIYTTITGSAAGTKDRIIVTGSFTDGTKDVILLDTSVA